MSGGTRPTREGRTKGRNLDEQLEDNEEVLLSVIGRKLDEYGTSISINPSVDLKLL
jgi:hypothetical protein